MRVLACSDIHGDKTLVKKLAERAEKEEVDTVVMCGDLTEFEKDLKGLIGSFKKRDKKVLLISGNHESKETIEQLVDIYKPGVESLDSKYFEEGDVGFFGSGPASFFSQTTEDPLDYNFEKIKENEKKIMVVHAPPFGTETDRLGGRHVGSHEIRQAIEELQPDFCLCGHIHENWGKIDEIGKTKVINVGKEGTLIEI